MRHADLQHLAGEPADAVEDGRWRRPGRDERQRRSDPKIGHGVVVSAADGGIGQGGVAHGHLRSDVPEQGHERLQAHAGVPRLVG